jgi:hypothetical protein
MLVALIAPRARSDRQPVGRARRYDEVPRPRKRQRGWNRSVEIRSVPPDRRKNPSEKVCRCEYMPRRYRGECRFGKFFGRADGNDHLARHSVEDVLAFAVEFAQLHARRDRCVPAERSSKMAEAR